MESVTAAGCCACSAFGRSSCVGFSIHHPQPSYTTVSDCIEGVQLRCSHSFPRARGLHDTAFSHFVGYFRGRGRRYGRRIHRIHRGWWHGRRCRHKGSGHRRRRNTIRARGWRRDSKRCRWLSLRNSRHKGPCTSSKRRLNRSCTQCCLRLLGNGWSRCFLYMSANNRRQHVSKTD